MDVDHILRTFDTHGVESLLIGGMNFLLRHEPVLTYDVDLWIRDEPANLQRCEAALAALDAAWGATEAEWRPVAEQSGWLTRQSVYCLTSPSGAIDVFREVDGLSSWEAAARRAVCGNTAGGAAYRGLCDEDMIICQMALPENLRRAGRIETLERAVRGRERGT